MADPWTEALQMLLCGLAVAAGVAPIGLAAWWGSRRRGDRLLPKPRGWRVPWAGFELFVALFVVSQFIPALVAPTLGQSGFYQKIYGTDFPQAVSARDGDAEENQRQAEAMVRRSIWVGLISLPMQLGLLLLLRQMLHPNWRLPQREPAFAASIALAGIAWLALSTFVLMIHFGVLEAFRQFDWTVEEHPLARVKPAETPFDRFIFSLMLCLSAPIIEEVLFRGVLLPWLIGRKHRSWPVLVVAVAIAAAVTWNPTSGLPWGPITFAIGLVGGWVVLRAAIRKKRRTVGAIYASAALFAVVHSNVWPSPIPLFVLGLGLGWLAVRTRGVLVPIIVHGLFNAVSVLFVLRGG